MEELKTLDSAGTFGALSTALTNMKEQDWAENWTQYYKPLKVGDKIMIRPEWEEVADSEGRTVFQINPCLLYT